MRVASPPLVFSLSLSLVSEVTKVTKIESARGKKAKAQTDDVNTFLVLRRKRGRSGMEWRLLVKVTPEKRFAVAKWPAFPPTQHSNPSLPFPSLSGDSNLNK